MALDNLPILTIQENGIQGRTCICACGSKLFKIILANNNEDAHVYCDKGDYIGQF